jgi:hypothetical protein
MLAPSINVTTGDDQALIHKGLLQFVIWESYVEESLPMLKSPKWILVNASSFPSHDHRQWPQPTPEGISHFAFQGLFDESYRISMS